jgi:hypothetical protein
LTLFLAESGPKLLVQFTFEIFRKLLILYQRTRPSVALLNGTFASVGNLLVSGFNFVIRHINRGRKSGPKERR